MKKFFQSIIDFLSLKILSPINWGRIKFLLTGREFDLTPAEREKARDLMEGGYYLWVSRRKTHLTSYFIGFADFALALWAWLKSGFKGKRPKFGYWTHAFIDVDNEKLVEAIAKGVVVSYFDDVFDVDCVAALVPSFLTEKEWENVSEKMREKALSFVGSKYDTIFNLDDESKVSCIELLRAILKAEVPNYEQRFKHFEETIKKNKNVTPQMLYDSKSFRVVWEVRH